MRKIAFFVEGQTESLFVSRLVMEMAGKERAIVERRHADGGRKRIRSFRVTGRTKNTGQGHFVLIVDCGGDSSVKSDIREQYDSLAASGYETIIAIRDVYPQFSYEEIPKLRRGLAANMRTTPVEVKFALGIMEIEAWFIAEHTHFQRLNPILTPQKIKAALGFDPCQDGVDHLPHPAETLNDIYHLGRLAYTKHKRNTERTVHALDCARMYMDLRKEIPDLGVVVDCIERFLAS